MKQETKTLIENMDAEIGDLQQQLADMTESRDALAYALKRLAEKRDRRQVFAKERLLSDAIDYIRHHIAGHKAYDYPVAGELVREYDEMKKDC